MIGETSPPSSAPTPIYASPFPSAGLQTQPDKARLYAGPWDAIRKIYSAHGIVGIYKGQVATLCREASGYGVYFWTYEKLMEREMTQKGIRRDQVNPAKTVLFGAASGYTVRRNSFPFSRLFLLTFSLWRILALGSDIPDRHDQVSDADGWIFSRYREKVQLYVGLREDDLEGGGDKGVHAGVDPHAYSVRLLCQSISSEPASQLVTYFNPFLVRRSRMEPPSWALRWR